MLYPDHAFSEQFCNDLLVACEDAIDSRQSFNLVAIPGVGVTFFVKYLERRLSARFVYINPYEMHEFSKQAVYAQLAKKLGMDEPGSASVDDIRRALLELSQSASSVVILFNRFDRVSGVVDERFYDVLRHLRDANRSKIVIGFVTGVPLINDARLARSLMGLVTRTVYFSGYGDTDMQQILAGSGARAATDQELRLAGGHHVLLQVLMGCQDMENALSDPMVELVIKDMLASLPQNYRRHVERLALKGAGSDDAFLLGTHFVSQEAERTILFTPLMEEYIRRSHHVKLPQKEQRLFDVLARHGGRVVNKQEIFDYVWREQNGIASEWALNALVYRLRRHPGFDARRYEIESHKKSGYVLIDTQHA